MELYTVSPSGYPVTLAEVKLFLKVTNTAEDALITALITACTERLEQYTGQYFISRTVQGDFSNMFISGTESYPWIKLRRVPVIAITSVQVSVGDTFVDESYQLKTPTHGFARILFNDFTDTLDDVPYPLQIVFTAGYGNADDVPENIKLAIKMCINSLFRNRGDCGGTCESNGSALPSVIRSLVAPYKIIEVYA